MCADFICIFRKFNEKDQKVGLSIRVFPIVKKFHANGCRQIFFLKGESDVFSHTFPVNFQLKPEGDGPCSIKLGHFCNMIRVS